MGFRTFEIVLDPDLPVYIAGLPLKGYVRVSTSERVDCKYIKVWVKGWAKVKWEQGGGKSRRMYKAKEEYFRTETVLWSKTESNSFPTESSTFPFIFILPPNIPSSFKSKYGKVVYKVKAQAYFPYAFNQNAQKFFSVNFLYDLNRDLHALTPVSMKQEKTLYVCFCSQGTIRLSFKAQRSGYVPGESVMVWAEVDNDSSSNIEYTEIKLEQLITYIVRGHTLKKQRTVQRQYHQHVPMGEKDVWSAVPLAIPPLPSSHLLHCNLITIHYDITFKAKIDPFRSVEVKAPIVIGSLPLQATYPTFYSPSPSPPFTSAPPSHSPSFPSPNIPPSALPALPHQSYDAPPPPYTSLLPEEYREIPPPSYAACAFGAEEAGGGGGGSDDSDDEGGFAPQYLIYRTNL